MKNAIRAMHRRLLMIGLAVVTAGALGSCGKSPAPPAPQAAEAGPAPVHKTFGTGPVKLTVNLSAASITTAETANCRLILQIGEGFEAEFPDLRFPDDVPGMILTDYKESETRNGPERVLTREYELEPEYDGTFKLPAMQVYYHKAGEIKEEMIETEPIELTVAKTSTSAETLVIKPVRGLITADEIAAQHRRIWPWAVGGGLAIIGVVALCVYWLRRPRTVPPPPPAHEIALEALRQLVAKDLVGNGRIEQFFVEITAIVRDYIERAFGLRAPEQTTEEFLAGIASQPIVARHRDALAPFLSAADEVKFACMTPDKAVIQRTFDTARDFVLQTSAAKEGTA